MIRYDVSTLSGFIPYYNFHHFHYNQWAGNTTYREYYNELLKKYNASISTDGSGNWFVTFNNDEGLSIFVLEWS